MKTAILSLLFVACIALSLVGFYRNLPEVATVKTADGKIITADVSILAGDVEPGDTERIYKNLITGDYVIGSGRELQATEEVTIIDIKHK